MYNNPYITYNSQSAIERINNQMAELEKMKEQLQRPMQQPTNLTQNFQIAPANREVIRYAGTIEEVQKEMVAGDTPFFSRDMSVVWIKSPKGYIKTYELNEIVSKDDKDILIEGLQFQVAQLRKEIKNARTNNDDVDESVESEEPSNVSIPRTSKKKQ